MNKYVERVIADVKKQYADQPEFVQTVEEVFSSARENGHSGESCYVPRSVGR